MTRRQLMIVGLLSPLSEQELKQPVFNLGDKTDFYTTLEVTFPVRPANFKGEWYAMTIRCGEEELKFTPEEIIAELKRK